MLLEMQSVHLFQLGRFVLLAWGWKLGTLLVQDLVS